MSSFTIIIVMQFFSSLAVYIFVSLFLSEEEEGETEHNWVFSADQMDVLGGGNALYDKAKFKSSLFICSS